MIDLPNIRGQIKRNIPLSSMSWLKVGGPAEILFKPSDISDLQQFLAKIDNNLPILVLGACSNLLIRDGGIEGVCIRLGKEFNKITIHKNGLISVGAACFGSHLARKAASAGIDLTFLSTIPGTIGGAVCMNAGCYGRYIKDVFVSAEFVSAEGLKEVLSAEDLEFSYRKSNIPQGWIMTSAVFKSDIYDPEYLNSKMEEMIKKRNNTQPRGDFSCGSAFKNPIGRASSGQFNESNKKKAWKMIDDAGLRGFRLGGAKVSTKHSNFLINIGDATSAQIEELGETIIKEVFDHCGIKLEWEIKIVGKKTTSCTKTKKWNFV